jgi:hypothetical protein
LGWLELFCWGVGRIFLGCWEDFCWSYRRNFVGVMGGIF